MNTVLKQIDVCISPRFVRSALIFSKQLNVIDQTSLKYEYIIPGILNYFNSLPEATQNATY